MPQMGSEQLGGSAPRELRDTTTVHFETVGRRRGLRARGGPVAAS